MYLTNYLLLILHLQISFSEALKGKPKIGCNIGVPKHVGVQKEASGDHGKPLIIFVDIKVLSIRDVPDSGGSYAMDVK